MPVTGIKQEEAEVQPSLGVQPEQLWALLHDLQQQYPQQDDSADGDRQQQSPAASTGASSINGPVLLDNDDNIDPLTGPGAAYLQFIKAAFFREVKSAARGRESVSTLEQELKIKNEENAMLRHQVYELECELRFKHGLLSDATDQANTLESQLKDARHDLSFVQQDLASVKALCQDHEQSANFARSQSRVLMKDIASLRQEMYALEEQLDEYQRVPARFTCLEDPMDIDDEVQIVEAAEPSVYTVHGSDSEMTA
ncbi:hypothetical protein HXX76_011795 [Chlamydomonas incerta]|uniref:Uncharacterized protein n=1 Tax=Chlamydomonas incerta TaxID=51695 RepID=A0A835VWI5_CHLIN|nr:hypothetical protein HXX76_011795 [Chlamydomonas incerta]|eukprot:KAG2428114.1 hypothetical protein HXX76_011795 [Chlamydomonas incerta]